MTFSLFLPAQNSHESFLPNAVAATTELPKRKRACAQSPQTRTRPKRAKHAMGRFAAPAAVTVYADLFVDAHLLMLGTIRRRVRAFVKSPRPKLEGIARGVVRREAENLGCPPRQSHLEQPIGRRRADRSRVEPASLRLSGQRRNTTETLPTNACRRIRVASRRFLEAFLSVSRKQAQGPPHPGP